MSEPSTWRSLRSVMLLTLHVAAFAAVIRFLNISRGRESSLLICVGLAVGLASFVSWPIARSFFSALGNETAGFDRACPVCRRLELRPLVRRGHGIFDRVTNYRCAGCWTTIRMEGERRLVESPSIRQGTSDRSGIRFLDELVGENEIVFLDESSHSAD